MFSAFAIHDVVTCKVSIPRLGLDVGAVGVINQTHGRGLAFDVEFMHKNGVKIGIETVDANDLIFQIAPIYTQDDYKKALYKATKLGDRSPAPGTPDHYLLESLLVSLGRYESGRVS